MLVREGNNPQHSGRKAKKDSRGAERQRSNGHNTEVVAEHAVWGRGRERAADGAESRFGSEEGVKLESDRWGGSVQSGCGRRSGER